MVTNHLTTHIAPAIFNKRKNLLFIECFENEKLRIFICAMNNESKNEKCYVAMKQSEYKAAMHLKAMIWFCEIQK